MAKKEIRMVTASSDAASIIDRGASVKTELDNLGYEDKGLKFKISEIAVGQLEDGEGSIRLEGTDSVATVSESVKLDINVQAEQYPKLKETVKIGFLPRVTVKKNLVIPKKDIDKAAEILLKAGITANVVESLNITANDMCKMSQNEEMSLEESTALQTLKSCIESSKSYRVRYSNK